MIYFVYKYKDKLKQGVFISDNKKEIENNIPLNCKYWILDDNISIEDITEYNYNGIGKSTLHLRVLEDEENI